MSGVSILETFAIFVHNRGGAAHKTRVMGRR